MDIHQEIGNRADDDARPYHISRKAIYTPVAQDDLTVNSTKGITPYRRSTSELRPHRHRKSTPSADVQTFIDTATLKEEGNVEKPPSASGWWPATFEVLDHWWFWEVFGLLGSALTLLAMAILLEKFDQQKQPSWKLVSLNTVVAWLSTLSRLLISIPLSAGVGQLKWMWFAERKRSLADLGVFDSASRGVIGSICLLWTTRGRHIAGIGAFATILAVAFDPFNQALLHYYQENVEDLSHIARLATSPSFGSYGPLVGGSQTNVDPVMKANVYNSMFNPDAYQSWGIPEYVCSSGNCTWDPVASLEARSLCTDITPELNKICSWNTDFDSEQCNLTLPNGGASAWYIIGSEKSWAAQALVMKSPVSKPIVYVNATAPSDRIAPSMVVTQSIMALGLDPSKGARMAQDVHKDTQWVATECSLELQVRSVNVSIQNSVYRETTLATWSKIAFDQVAIPGTDDSVYYRFVIPEDPSLGVPKDNHFYISYNAQSSMNYGLYSHFNGTVYGWSDILEFGEPGTLSSDVLQTLFVQNFTTCAHPADKLNCLMSNTAAAMSKTFRDSALTVAKAAGYNATSQNAPNTADMAIGRTTVSATFVKVRWEWLGLPVLVWILTVITWLSAVVMTWRTKVQKWRNDVVPLLFLYREDQVGEGTAGEDGCGGVAADTGVTRFSLRAQNTKARLVVRQKESKLE